MKVNTITSAEMSCRVTAFDPDASCWFPIYTCSRQEKVVAEQLRVRGVEQFLPLYTAARNWNGRRATVQLPLFPGYVFARFSYRDRLLVLNSPGVAQIVAFGGIPAVLDDLEVEGIRAAVLHGKAEPHPWIQGGRRVRIRSGAMAGLEGVVLRRKNRIRVVVAVEALNRAMGVEVDVSEVEPVVTRWQRQVTVQVAA